MLGKADRIVIDVRVDGDEITRNARNGVGARKPFTGWLGLVRALDGLLGVPSSPGAEPTARVCVAFANTEEAEEFAASGQLREAILETDSEPRPEIWSRIRRGTRTIHDRRIWL
jgi:hypothetical protein